MVKIPVIVKTLKGIQPASDIRQTQDHYVMDGRNFYFDSKGPKSGFGTKLVDGLYAIDNEGGATQSLEAGERVLIMTERGAWTIRGRRWSHIPVTYRQAIDFTQFPDLPNRKQYAWTSAYLAGTTWVAHPRYGYYKVQSRILRKVDQSMVLGLPDGIIACCENNGRIAILSRNFFSWSAPGKAARFIPELGGAGQQALKEKVSGKPIAMTSLSNGVLIWTKTECLFCEFVGGNTVYRFINIAIDQIPLNARCVTRFTEASHFILTRQGVHTVRQASAPEPLTPGFNEFFREWIKNHAYMTCGIQYIKELDQLFVMCADHTNHYVTTFVLNIALDRWGVFNERHQGVIRLQSYDKQLEYGTYGFVDEKGVAHRFVRDYSRETAPGVYEGLDSFIDFGYFKPQELQREADALLEMQELTIGGIPRRPSWMRENVLDLGRVPYVAPQPLAVEQDFHFDFISGPNNYMRVRMDPSNPAYAGSFGGNYTGEMRESVIPNYDGAYADGIITPYYDVSSIEGQAWSNQLILANSIPHMLRTSMAWGILGAVGIYLPALNIHDLESDYEYPVLTLYRDVANFHWVEIAVRFTKPTADAITGGYCEFIMSSTFFPFPLKSRGKMTWDHRFAQTITAYFEIAVPESRTSDVLRYRLQFADIPGGFPFNTYYRPDLWTKYGPLARLNVSRQDARVLFDDQGQHNKLIVAKNPRKPTIYMGPHMSVAGVNGWMLEDNIDERHLP